MIDSQTQVLLSLAFMKASRFDGLVLLKCVFLNLTQNLSQIDQAYFTLPYF